MSDAGNNDVTTDDIDENYKRSERKRQREKQRRSDLTSAFEELSDLILKIEPGVLPVKGKKKKKTTDGGRGGSDTLGLGMTRLDIVARTVEVVKALYDENEKNKRMLEEMKRPDGTRDEEKVLVMVPTLTLVDDPPPSSSSRGRGMPSSQVAPPAPLYGHPRHSNYPYHQGPPAFAPPFNPFAPPYFAPTQPPMERHHLPTANTHWGSNGSPNRSLESRGMPPESQQPQQQQHHPYPGNPHYYDYWEYSRRNDSRNSDDHSQPSDRSLEPEEI